MTTRLEIKVDGPDVSATKMLLVASNTLKLLKAVEKNIRKEKGGAPITWRVDMMSGGSYGLIAIWALGPDTTHLQADLRKLLAEQAAKKEAK